MIEIKRWDTGAVIHAGEFASVKECLEDGVKKGVSFFRANLSGCILRGCDLRGCDLRGSILIGCNLRGSILIGCNLSGCDLRGSDLRGCDMRDSILRGCDLRGCDLTGSNLRGCDLTGSTGANDRIFCMQHGRYHIVVVDDICHGGCTTKTLGEWLDYDGADLCADNKNYLETITKPFIKMVIASREQQ